MLVPCPYLTSDKNRSAYGGGKAIGIVIAGSTGSIGTSTLDIVRSHPDLFRVVGLSAHRNIATLKKQIAEFSPRVAVMTGQSSAPLEEGIHFGMEALETLCADPECDFVVLSIVGSAALRPLLAALKAGKRVALANKESIVCGASFVRAALAEYGGEILPVDSEHSALFQLLHSARGGEEVQSLTLTASGGPFLKRLPSELHSVTPAEAVKHPRWNMGAKISIDSATLVNKALELIEAHELFGIDQRQISVLIHPESIIHALVTFKDGVQLAHCSVPDMKAAIGYALQWPRSRIANLVSPLDLAQIGALHFEPLNDAQFPAVRLARHALGVGGAATAIFNAANEGAVAAFLAGTLAFDRIVPSIDRALSRFSGRKAETLAELFSLEQEVTCSI